MEIQTRGKEIRKILQRICNASLTEILHCCHYLKYLLLKMIFQHDVSQLLCFKINLCPTLLRAAILKGLKSKLGEEHFSMQQVALQ